jgi:alkanesulfonate monooxygenase SsuD/methylene tetrahydromethanopterin reductase-like flavin-dependent oxidoreductase (luciferase family)
LPLADLCGGVPAAEDVREYVVAARGLGYSTVAANDHLVWSHPWLDASTALASVAASVGEMALATSIALPVVRHPAVVAKTLTTLALLARGPVVGGLGPGSSRHDHQAVATRH